MDIREILNEIGIDYKSSGNTRFDTLGLLGANVDMNICSFIVDARYKDNISDNVSVLLVPEDLANDIDVDGICIVDNPRLAFFSIHNFLCTKPDYVRREEKTVIGDNAQISDLAYIAEKNVVIGNNVTIEEFVSIKENVVIGDNCIIRAGSIIGGEGFEQKRTSDAVMAVKHAGGVVIGDNVELQQNNCVDKAIYPWDNTEIGDYCRTDNKVHIAHGVKMRKRVLIAACTCVAGRVTLEDDVWIGPGVTLINGMHVGKGARVNIGSVATKDVPEGNSVTGNFAIDHHKFIDYIKSIR